MSNCVDCPDQNELECGDVCSTSYGGVVSSCMTSLGITPKMPTCTLLSKLADGICNVMQDAVFGVCAKDIAFVSPEDCGDDATGIVGRLDKPFATIKGAVKAARIASGKLVCVWSGDYTESKINFGSDGVEWQDPKFYFVLGATVDGDTESVLSTGTMTSAVTIGGYGILSNSANGPGHGVVQSTSSNTATYDITCLEINQNGSDSPSLQMQNGSVKLKCSSMYCSGSSCVDVRIGTTTGYVTCDLMDNSDSATRAPAVKFNSGTNDWVFNVKQTYSNPNNVNAGVFVLGSLSRVTWNGNVTVVSSDSPGSYCSGIGTNGGELIFTGMVRTTGCSGICNVSGLLQLNGAVRTIGDFPAVYSAFPSGSGKTIINGDAVNASDTIATILYQVTAASAIVQVNGIVKNESATSGNKVVEMTAATQKFISKGAYLLSASTTGISITGTGIANLTNTWSNVDPGGSITYPIETVNKDADLEAYVPV